MRPWVQSGLVETQGKSFILLKMELQNTSRTQQWTDPPKIILHVIRSKSENGATSTSGSRLPNSRACKAPAFSAASSSKILGDQRIEVDFKKKLLIYLLMLLMLFCFLFKSKSPNVIQTIFPPHTANRMKCHSSTYPVTIRTVTTSKFQKNQTLYIEKQGENLKGWLIDW